MYETLRSNLKLIVFDFDGTLVDSNPIKLQAFDICFADFTVTHPEILSYCHRHHHTPRWIKFRHVYENILKKPYTKDIEADLHKRYAEATTQAIINAPEIPGALPFVKSVSASHQTALLSSTPHEVLLEILDGRGWRSHFGFIQGAPIEKSIWIRDLAKRLGFSQDQLIFIGDSWEDSQSAKEAGCPFLAISNSNLAEQGHPFVKDFTELRIAA